MSPITRHTAIAMILTLISATTTLQAQEPSGGPLCRLVSRIRQHRNATIASAPAVAMPAPTAASAAGCDCSGGSDPYGFASILNRLRAAAGLHPVAYDPELSSWASQNNSAQCHRGIGHHVNPCGVQNCGWNYADASALAQGWMNSPGHRQNLLSPSISRFGIAYGPGPYWTLNAQ
jgi:uncharacterized protein YkwD